MTDKMTISELKRTCCCGGKMVGPRCPDHPPGMPPPLSLYEYRKSCALSRPNQQVTK